MAARHHYTGDGSVRVEKHPIQHSTYISIFESMTSRSAVAYLVASRFRSSPTNADQTSLQHLAFSAYWAC